MENILNKIVGERIRDVRNENKLKQADLAKALDSSAALISNIEKGMQSIQLIDLYKIAKLLGKKVYYFLPSLEELREAVPSIDKDMEKLPPQEATFVDSLRKQIK